MQALKAFPGKVGFLGAGNMASALIRGMLRAGLPPARIFVRDLDEARVEGLCEELSVHAAADAEELTSSSDVIILAVKPPAVVDAVRPLASLAADKLWISVAAGVDCATLQAALGPCRIVRAMPNTPALVGAGATGLCAGAQASVVDLDTAELLFSSVGVVERVVESQMDALTGLSGSGPAFIMLVIEAMADAAVEAGLARSVALKLAAQTVRGAGALALESGLHPAQLKDQVTSPGGTTIAGVAALEAGGLRATMMSAVRASTARSRALSGK